MPTHGSALAACPTGARRGEKGPRRYITLIVAAALIVGSLWPRDVVHAQWQPGGAPVCTAAGNQGRLAMVAAAAGGAFIAWEDNRDSAATGNDIYIQRLGVDGVPQWTPDGVTVCTSPADQWSPHTVADGVGGVIVVWEDRRDGPQQLYAQRLDAFGVAQWAADGILVSSGISQVLYGYGHAAASSIASDGAGGAIIVWEEYLTGFDWNVYAQRLSADGSHPWGMRGVPISLAYSFQVLPTLAADGLGGAVITWEDWREHPVSNVYAQRIDAFGTPLWTPNGVAVSGPGQHYAPVIISPSPGRALIAWHECSPNLDDIIRAQRLDPSSAPEWAAGGVEVSHAPGPRQDVSVVLDGAGGVTAVWMDGRTNSDCLGGCKWDVYGQRVDALGQTLWTPGGVQLHQTTEGHQYLPRAAPDGSGGAFVVWSLPGFGLSSDLAFQHVDSSGVPDLAPDGVPFEGPGIRYLVYAIVSDGAGGAIAAWVDDRNGGLSNLGEVYGGDIYALRVPVAAQVSVGDPGLAGSPLALPRPNPMRSATEIAFRSGAATAVTLEVFDITGQRVRTLAADQEFGGGTHRLLWDGRDDAGLTVATGIYLIRLAMGGRGYSQRVIVLR